MNEKLKRIISKKNIWSMMQNLFVFNASYFILFFVFKQVYIYQISNQASIPFFDLFGFYMANFMFFTSQEFVMIFLLVLVQIVFRIVLFENRKLYLIMQTMLFGGIAIFLWSTSIYFEVYEVQYHPSHTGGMVGEGLDVASLISEISFFSWTLLVVVGLLIVTFVWLYRRIFDLDHQLSYSDDLALKNEASGLQKLLISMLSLKKINFFNGFVTLQLFFLFFMSLSNILGDNLPQKKKLHRLIQLHFQIQKTSPIFWLHENSIFYYLRNKDNFFAKYATISSKEKLSKTLSAFKLTKQYLDKFQFGYDTTSVIKLGKNRILYPKSKRKKMNVIVYVIEGTTYQYANLSIEGKAVMPNFQKLRKQSLHFQNHYSLNPLSIHAQLGLLAGIYNLPTDRWAQFEYPNLKIKTMPELLKKQGYNTALISSEILRGGRNYPFLKNRFDLIRDSKSIRGKRNMKTLNWGLDDRELQQPALKFALNSIQQKKPFFMSIFGLTPHHPYDVPSPKYNIFKDASKVPGRNKRIRKKFLKYLNSLHYADIVLGEFLRLFKDNKILENTLLVVVSDHGESFYQHRGNYNHSYFIYEENVHSIMLLHAPAVFKKGKEIKEITRHIDLAPSILHALNIAKPKYYEGINLFATHYNQFAPLHTSYRDKIFAIRDAHWKYIHNFTRKSKMLFNLNEDPHETKNLINENQHVAITFDGILADVALYKEAFYYKMTGKFINKKVWQTMPFMWWNKKKESKK